MTIVAAVGQLVAWFKQRRFSAAVIGGAYSLIYLADMMNVALTRRTYLAPSIGERAVSDGDTAEGIFIVVATWWLFSLWVGVVQVKSHRSEKGAVVKFTRLRWFTFLMLSLALCGVVSREILATGIAQTLAARQGVFAGGMLLLIGYFVLPVLVPFGVVGASRLRGIGKGVAYALCVLILVITGLTGSRSALFLSAILPALLFWCKRAVLGSRGIKRDMKIAAMVALGVMLPVLGGSVYLAATRGLVEERSLLNRTDVSQADVLVDMVTADLSGVSDGSSYLAALGSAIPRSIWEAKPLPGNVLSSMYLTPGRYSLTGAETTAGLLGEAYLSMGIVSPLAASLLMILLVAGTARLMASADDYTWILGVVLLLRGVNLLRGDLTNVLTPALLAVFVWFLLVRREESPPNKQFGDVHDYRSGPMTGASGSRFPYPFVLPAKSLRKAN